MTVEEGQPVRKIVVGYDDTDEGRDAIALAALLAEPTGAELVLLFVYPIPYYPAYYFGPPETGVEQIAAAEIVQRAASAVPNGITVRTKAMADFSIAQGIQATAESEEADLIVLGSHGKGLLARVTMSRIAERLLHGSSCGVAVAPRGYAAGEPGLKQIAAGFDGSEESRLALRTAERLAAASGAALRVVTVVPPFPAWTASVAVLSDEEKERANAHFRKALDEAVADLDSAVAFDAVMRKGDPAIVLSEEAETGVDLLVVGSRRYGPLQRVLLGSVSFALLRKVPCPVLVTPRGEQGSAGEA